MYRRALLIVMAVILPASALIGAFPQTASADGTPTPYLAPAVIDAATKSTERNSLAKCIGDVNGYAFKNSNYGYDIKPSDIASGSWFSDYTNVRQWYDYNNGDSGHGTDCDKVDAGKIVSDLAIAPGNIQAACALGVKRKDTKQDCVNGSGNMYYVGGNKQDVLNAIDKTYKGTQFGQSYSPEQLYVMSMSLLLNDKTCKGSPLALASTATIDQKNQANTSTLTVIGSDGVATQVLYKFNGNTSTKWSLMNFEGNDGGYVAENCDTLAKRANANANAYAKWVGVNQPGSAGNPGTCEQFATLQVGGTGQATGAQKDTYSTLLSACNDGLANKTTPNYCNKYKPKPIPRVPVTDQQSPEYDACLYGYGTALASTPTGAPVDNPTAGDKPTCGIQGIGWLICPVMSFMASIADEAYNFLASYFLTIDSKLVSDPSTNAAWARFRDIANVAFVIALIVVVYSQVTSFGISSYGIKRMLPRIIVAALLVNVSFYICAAAVDLSNLLGYAIPQFFKAIPIGAGLPDSGGLSTAGNVLKWVDVIGVVIVAGIGIALALSVPVLLAALLAIGLIVLMLVARQALVILLIVISPLAFVAYLLPNTEQWFKKWYKMLFTLLLLFPVIGTVFGASQLAAGIIANTGGNGSGANVTKLIALAVEAIPFFVVPGMLKGSLTAAGALGAKMQGMANKAGGKVGARAKDSSYLGAYMAQRKKISATNRAQSYGTKKGLTGFRGRLSAAGISGKAGSHLATTGQALASKEEAEAVEHEMIAMQKQDGWREDNRLDKAHDEFVEAMQSGDATRARAAQRILLGSGNAGITKLQSGYEKLGGMETGKYEDMMVSGTGQKVLSDLSSSGIKGKNAALDKMAHTEPISRDQNGNTTKNTVDSIAGAKGTYTALTDSELAGQSAGNLQLAASSGGLDSARAQRIKENDTVWSQLSEDKKQIISNVAGSAPSPAPSGGQAPPPAGSTTLTIPHGGGTPPPSPPAGGQAPPPGMTQTPSGLFIPTGINNPGNNPPSPPPANP